MMLTMHRHSHASAASRRRFVIQVSAAMPLAGGGWISALAPSSAVAATLAEPATIERRERSMQLAVAAFTGGKPLSSGTLVFDVPKLVENGNSVPIDVEVPSVAGGASELAVKRLALFNERNPIATMVVASFGPAAARARLSVRVRLATSQTLVAVAELNDGRFIGAQTEVIVTLAACIEDAPFGS